MLLNTCLTPLTPKALSPLHVKLLKISAGLVYALITFLKFHSIAQGWLYTYAQGRTDDESLLTPNAS